MSDLAYAIVGRSGIRKTDRFWFVGLFSTFEAAQSKADDLNKVSYGFKYPKKSRNTFLWRKMLVRQLRRAGDKRAFFIDGFRPEYDVYSIDKEISSNEQMIVQHAKRFQYEEV
jgi:hypothetical protein